MKVVFFIGSLWAGGAERVITKLAKHFVDIGYIVEIVLLLDTTVVYPVSEKIKLVYLVPTNKKRNYLLNLPFWIRKIRAYVKETRPDCIISFVGRINLLVLTACMGLNQRIIISERNDPKHDGRGKFILSVCNLLYRKADFIVFQTSYEQSCFSKKLNNISKIIVNPVGVHLKTVQPKEKVIATAGRLAPQKNQKLLIKAFSKVCKQFTDYNLKIYGDGPLENDLKKLIELYRLKEHVFLCGHIANIHEELQKATIFVMTSNYEGLSNSLVEAMMLGLPCITTNYDGANEVVENKINGLIVPMDDEVALAKALTCLINDEEYRNRLGNLAKSTSSKYLEESVFAQWDQIVNEAINNESIS